MIERYSRPAMKKVWSDERKYQVWLQAELAVCEAWAEVGVVPKEALPKLRRASFDMERIAHHFKETRHDMNAFLRAVAESLGEEGRWVHLGLTSYDVQDTALGLLLREASDLLLGGLRSVEAVLIKRAKEHKDTLMMGRTHGIHAEPVTFGLKLAGWLEEVRRDIVRLEQARASVTVGKVSGVVGSHATVPLQVEEIACAKLGLAVDPVSTQVIQRDRHAQFVLTVALIAASLERFALEIRHLQRTEVQEVEEPFSDGQTGSSAMPHKRNPELSERICGLARLLRGHAVTALDNVALWHERDISHSSAERLILPDSCLALDYMLAVFAEVMEGLKVRADRMRENLELTKGLVFSQRVLIALIEKGMGRTEAYKLVQGNAMKAWEKRLDFRDLLRRDREVSALLSPRELEALFDYRYYTREVDATFKRVGVL
ncbi:MAG: adenylosuccinate lyase [Chloroflexi bacterium]|nr:adenylosuccinate lyase [Chloroflexota bacterium]